MLAKDFRQKIPGFTLPVGVFVFSSSFFCLQLTVTGDEYFKRILSAH